VPSKTGPSPRSVKAVLEWWNQAERLRRKGCERSREWQMVRTKMRLWWGDMHRMRWTRRTVNRIRLTEWSWFHRWGDAYVKERLVIYNKEDTNGRARVTTDKEGSTRTGCAYR